MTTRDLIQGEIDRLDELSLQKIYGFIQQMSAQSEEKPSSGLLAKLRQIKLDGPVDFAENIDLYLNEPHHGDTHLS